MVYEGSQERARLTHIPQPVTNQRDSACLNVVFKIGLGHRPNPESPQR